MKKTKKLALTRATVRSLVPNELLHRIAGGALPATSMDCTGSCFGSCELTRCCDTLK